MKILWCLGEEQISHEILNCIKWVCDDDLEINGDFETKFTNSYNNVAWEISGIKSNRYDKFIYILTSSTGNSFVDYMFFEGENLPPEDSKPFACVEATKNDGTEAGNMVSQRSSKKIELIEKYGDVKYAFLITNPSLVDKTSKSFKQAHKCDFATIIGLGGEVLIAQLNKFGYKKYTNTFVYNNLNEVDKQEHNKRKSSGVPSRVKLNETHVTIQANLNKGKKNGVSDPGIGYASSRLYLAYKLSPNIERRLINHGKDLKFFTMKNNKFINILKTIGVTIVFPDNSTLIIEKEENVFNKKYWEYTKKGEKIGSIIMEQEYLKRGYEVIFTNHAGCGKSFININGKSYTSSKGEGIPDLVLYKKETNVLLVIEAEQSKNYDSGIKQMENIKFDNFIKNNLIKHFNSIMEILKYLCTYGDYNNEPEVIFNVSDNLEIFENKNAKNILFN